MDHFDLYLHLLSDRSIDRYNTTQCVQTMLTLLFTVVPSVNTAHELLHRPSKVMQTLGFLNMVILQFTVYPIEHVQLHHKLVGTDKDPITSPKNRSLFFYYTAHKFVFNYNRKQFMICMALDLPWTAAGFCLQR